MDSEVVPASLVTVRGCSRRARRTCEGALIPRERVWYHRVSAAGRPIASFCFPEVRRAGGAVYFPVKSLRTTASVTVPVSPVCPCVARVPGTAVGGRAAVGGVQSLPVPAVVRAPLVFPRPRVRAVSPSP